MINPFIIHSSSDNMRSLLTLCLVLTVGQVMLEEESCSKDSKDTDCGDAKDDKYRKTVLITGRIIDICYY